MCKYLCGLLFYRQSIFYMNTSALDWNASENDYTIECKVFSPTIFCTQHEIVRKEAHINYHHVQRAMQNRDSSAKKRPLHECARLEISEREIYQKRFRYSLDYGHGKWMKYLQSIIESYELLCEEKSYELLSRLNHVFKSKVCPREFRKKSYELSLDPVQKYPFLIDCDPATGDWLTESQIKVFQISHLTYLDLNSWPTLRLRRLQPQALSPSPSPPILNRYKDEEW